MALAFCIVYINTFADAKAWAKVPQQTTLPAKTVWACIWLTTKNTNLHVNNKFHKKQTVAPWLNVVENFGIMRNYFGDPLIWLRLSKQNVPASRTTNTCKYYGQNTTNLAQQTKFRQIFKAFTTNNFVVHSLGKYNLLPGRGIPALNSRRVHT